MDWWLFGVRYVVLAFWLFMDLLVVFMFVDVWFAGLGSGC